MTITLEDQLKCAKRELAMRLNAYPKWVQMKRLDQEKADWEIACMQEIAKTLESLIPKEKELFE